MILKRKWERNQTISNDKKKKKTMKYKGRSYEETGIKRATSQKRISKMARVSSSLNVKGLKALFKRLGLFLRLIEKI